MGFGADRTVKVNVKADVSDLIGKFTAAGKATGDFSKSAVKHAGQHKEAWSKVGTGMALTGAAIGAGVLIAVKSFADFDKKMSEVRAVSGATAGEMDLLGAAALKAGADTKFSATEAATAEAELAKVGISTADILGGALTGSLNLAAAGNLELGRAAEISGQAMKIFSLGGADVGRIADVLASGANKSAADVEQLAQSLSQGGVVASQFGLGLEDTVGVLAAFADNALIGSDAGTSLKTMLLRLNPTTEAASAAMEKVGLDAYDAQGNFIGLEAVAGQLQAGMSGLSQEQRDQAMATIFGQDALRASNILYRLGADGVAKYTAAVNDNGAAARVAAINMDNLSGDLEQLRGSIETALIQGGSAGNDALRSLVQTVTGAVNTFGELPQPVQHGAVAVAAIAAAALLAGGGLLTLLPKVAATKLALAELGVTSAKTSAVMRGAWKAGIVVAVAAVGSELIKLSARANVADVSIQDLADSLAKVGSGAKGAGGLGDLFESGAKWSPFRQEVESSSEALKKFAESAQIALGDNFIDRVERLGNGGSLERFNKQVGSIDEAMASLVSSGQADQAAAMYERFLAAVDAANKQGANIPVDEVAAKFKKYQGALDATKVSADASGAAAKSLGGSIDGVAVSVEDATKAVDELIEGLAAAGLVQLSARAAARAFKDSVVAASAAVKENGRTLNTNTAAGRKNEAALDAVADAAIGQAKATYEATKTTRGAGPAQAAFRASLVRSRGELIATAQRFGLTRAEAKRYADRVLSIPAAKRTRVELVGAGAAISAAGQVAAAIARIPGRKTTDVVVRKIGAQNDALTRADGGYIPPSAGSGPRADDVPVLASGGEYFVQTKAVQKYGVHFFDQLNAMRFADGGLVAAGRASGLPGPSTQGAVGGNVTLNAFGNDSVQATEKALRQWEFQQVPR